MSGRRILHTELIIGVHRLPAYETLVRHLHETRFRGCGDLKSHYFLYEFKVTAMLLFTALTFGLLAEVYMPNKLYVCGTEDPHEAPDSRLAFWA